jgi:protein involved in polysaccharide export with SLBB domain
MTARFLGVVLAAALLAPAARAQTPRLAPVLQPGDAVRITVWRDSAMSGEFAIAADGSLRHPVYRTLRVAGVPLPDVEARIRTFLTRYQTEPQFVAEPLVRVTVGGEAARPALYYLSPELTIAQAMALAGGSTERGRTDRVRLITGGRVQSIKLDGRDAGGSLPVRSGDQLIVERRGSLFRDIVAPLFAIAGSAAAIITVTRERR